MERGTVMVETHNIDPKTGYFEADDIDPKTGYSIQSETIAQKAGDEAPAAVLRIAAAAGSSITDVPRWRLSDETYQRADPALGLRAAQRLAVAVRDEVDDYIRRCRGSGIGWHEVGRLLLLHTEAVAEKRPLATLAYDFASGRRGGPWGNPTAVMWPCSTCGNTIHDAGPAAGSPRDAEHGHADGCAQLAAAIADWDAATSQDT
jgi:hypothetical protein